MNHEFVGYSTLNMTKTGGSTVYDIDLINADLYFAFNTRVGERVMRPNWGCKIWDYWMEPSSAELRNDIVNEATRVCEEDTRLKVQNVNVYELDNGIRVEILLFYDPLNVINTFQVDFTNNETAINRGTNQ